MSTSVKAKLVHERHFRWRAPNISRLEGFSDAVFAFAVTLLVVSTRCRRLYRAARGDEGIRRLRHLFAVLILLWKEHTKYFRRYGLQSSLIVFLNSVLLFLVLLYVYPLKFLFGFLVGEMCSLPV